VNIDKKLGAWQQAGLVTADQAEAIRAFEEQRSGSAKSWIVGGLGAVGGLAIVGGLISLIAANWNNVPVAAKLLAMGLLLAGALVAALRLDRAGRPLVSDLFLLAHGLLALAAVGLVAQIYNLSSGPWRGLFLCAALAVPAAVVSRRSLLSDLPLAYALVGLGLWLDRTRALQEELRGFGGGLFAAALGGAMLLSSDLLASVHAAASVALRRWGAALAAVSAVAAAGILSVRASHSTRPTMLFVAAAVAALLGTRLFLTRRYATLAGTVLTFLLLGTAYAFTSAEVGVRFLGFVLFCAACAALAIASAQAGSKRLTNAFTLAIAARIVVLFVEVLRSLALTGLGLILTGLVFCAVAWGWWRLHGLVGPGGQGKPASQEAP
jgi:hypothetical protein